MRLGVNIDHTATLREARGTIYPDPVVAGMLCEWAGCDSIVVHLREDRRHIKERDVFLLRQALKIPLNLEMSASTDIVTYALYVKPQQATLVPERRKELTTEGGLDLINNYRKTERVVKKLQAAGIKVSVFIDPSRRQIEKAKKMGADHVEIHTGEFADANSDIQKKKEL
ncbi:MAG: pyridoxine 5'-phosphate synthase, partial [Candidatus Omnitrophota bacterium]